MSLFIPKLNPIEGVEFPNSVKKINIWLKKVDVLDAGTQIREFYQLILKINRSSIKAKTHLEILDLLRPKADFCIENLEKKYLKLSLPLSEKKATFFKLAVTIIEEMSLGYKISGEKLIEQNAFLGGGDIALALSRVLYYSNKLLLSYSQIYLELPSEIWQDINAAYYHATKHKLTSKNVNDPLSKSKKVNVEKLYKVACIFSISNPYGLRRGESVKLYNSLDEWTKNIKLSTSLSKKQINWFSVDVSQGYAPLPTSKEDAKKNVYVVFDDLIKKIAAQISEGDLQKLELLQGDYLNKVALHRLKKNWNRTKKPRSQRGKVSSDVTVEVGLKNINFHILEDLSLSDDPFAAFDDEDPFSDEDPFTDASGAVLLKSMPAKKTELQYKTNGNGIKKESKDEKEVWSSLEQGNILTFEDEQELAIKNKEFSAVKEQASDHVWKVYDVAAGGYNLHWTGSTSAYVAVGEVLGMREVKPINSPWHLAVIRWMQYRNVKEFNVGVETISNRAILAKVSRLENKVWQNSLLLPAIKFIEQPVTLLLPAFMFNLEEELYLKFNGMEIRITLSAIYEHTGSFTQFVVQYLGKNTIKDQTKDILTEKVSDEFDSLWEKL